MAKKQRQNLQRTEKRKYKSRYCSNENYITALQYIVERICAAKARYDKKELPFYFWEIPEWKGFWSSQTRRVSQLLKKYREDAIIKVIDKKPIYSLYAAWIEELIRKENDALEIAEKAAIQKSEENKKHESDILVGKTGRKSTVNNKIKRLLDMDEDNGEEKS